MNDLLKLARQKGKEKRTMMDFDQNCDNNFKENSSALGM